MKEVFILLAIFGLFATSSCKKDGEINSAANATMEWKEFLTYERCPGHFWFVLDDSNKLFKSNKIPKGFFIPNRDSYTTRVYIEYKILGNIDGCNNYIEVTKIQKAQ